MDSTPLLRTFNKNIPIMDFTEIRLSGKTRREHDLLGEMEIPAEYYFGVQTMRAVENFHISRVRLNFFPELIRALADVKQGAAMANRDLGLLDPAIADAIIRACEELRAGKLEEQFVVDMVQGGAGTSTNMNANEVIANRALELLGHEKGEYQFCHPNNHVNLSQSTNDAYPTAVRIALVRSIEKLVASLRELIAAFHAKGEEFSGIIKMGRTQLQDAVPMTLGQEFEAYAANLTEETERLTANMKLFFEINMGATAIGTGINADPDYAGLCTRYLREITGLPLVEASNMIEATSDTGAFIMNSSAQKRLAVKLSKICNDLRLMSSGPRDGLGEINLPARQNGSSIMPGKVNPTQCEAVTMVAVQVMGNDVAVSMAASQGNFELNVFMPVCIYNFLQSARLLAESIVSFNDRCACGIRANREKMEHNLHNSLMLVTALNPYIGYENAAKTAKKAYKENISLKEACVSLGFLTAERFDEVFHPENMI